MLSDDSRQPRSAAANRANEKLSQVTTEHVTTKRRKPRRVPQPKCPIRFGEPCTACQPGTSGPDDCQLVALVMDDPELHERMLDMNRRMRAKQHQDKRD